VGLGACGGDDDEPAATTAPAPVATQPAPATAPEQAGTDGREKKKAARAKRTREKREAREREHKKSDKPREVTGRPDAGGRDEDSGGSAPPKVQDKPGNSDSGYVPDN
jgi:hypothetical protein